ncbi:hypothetical protein ACSQ67_006009 [Phaseolus vulgaris]
MSNSTIKLWRAYVTCSTSTYLETPSEPPYLHPFGMQLISRSSPRLHRTSPVKFRISLGVGNYISSNCREISSTEISRFPSITDVDLSHNSLTGTIPSNFNNRSMLISLTTPSPTQFHRPTSSQTFILLPTSVTTASATTCWQTPHLRTPSLSISISDSDDHNPLSFNPSTFSRLRNPERSILTTLQPPFLEQT